MTDTKHPETHEDEHATDDGAPVHTTEGRDKDAEGAENEKDRGDQDIGEGDKPSSGNENDDDEAGDDGEERENFRDWLKRPRSKIIVAVVLLAIVGAIAWAVLWWLESRKWEVTANAYIQAPIARLSPGVAGHVGRVFVEDNQMVRAGQPILALAGASFRVSVANAEAQLATARAQLVQARAAARAARAQVAEADATADARAAEADRARLDYARYASLSAEALAEQQRDRAAGDARSAAATAAAARRSVSTQRARVDQAEADIVAAQARVRQAEATLESARLSQGDTLLVAPIAGRITQFDIEPGDYVTPTASVVAVVGHARWVEANFKENQLRLMRRGQPVEVTIDAYGDFKLPAVLDSVQAGTGSEFSALPRQNATANWVETVQRVPVRIRFRPDAFRNFPARADVVPGLSVEARVRVRRED